MTRFRLFFVMSIFLFFSCNEEKVPDELSTRLDGFWMADGYLNNIEEHRSVYASKDYDEAFWAFILEKDDLKDGSIEINGMTDHEGGLVANGVWNVNKNRFSCSLASDSFELWITRTDQVKLYFFNQNKKELYRRVKTAQDEFRKMLFPETYRDLTNPNVSIDKRGHASFVNAEPVTRFEVCSDFSGGPKTDLISFYKANDKDPSFNFCFKFIEDTLFLYEFARPFPDWEVGELKYKMLPEDIISLQDSTNL